MVDGDPPPPGWEKLLDPQLQRYFYVNHELKVRSWVNPGALDQDSDSSPQAPSAAAAAPQHQPGPAGGATRVAVINTGGFVTGAQRRYSGQAALATAERDLANKLSPRVEFVPLGFAPMLAGPPAFAHPAHAPLESQYRMPYSSLANQGLSSENMHATMRSSLPAALVFPSPLLGSRRMDGLQRSPSPQRVPAFRSPLLAPRGSSEPPPPKTAAEQAAENELAARQGSRRMDGLRRSLSPVLGEGGGRRLVDRRREAMPWRRPRDVVNMPIHASSPGVLQAPSRRGGSPIMSGDLHSSHGSAYEPTLRPLSYTEELTGKAERERRTYPAGKALRATIDQLPSVPLSRFPDALRREEARGKYFTDAPVQEARLARPLDTRSTLPSRWMDNPSLSYPTHGTLLRNSGSHEWPGGDNYQRVEDYLADWMRHGGARAAEMNQLRSEFSSKQRELAQELDAAYRHSQAQCDDLRLKFQTAFERRSVSTLPYGGDDISKQMLMADNQFLIEKLRDSEQSAYPTQTLRSSNGAMTSPSTRTSFSMSEQEGLLQICVYFHEQIQQARAMAQQERLRSTYLANELLGLQMQQRQTQWSTDKPVDRHNRVQERPATISSPPKEASSPPKEASSPPNEVSPEMLIDQYLGVYGDPSPSFPNAVVPKKIPYERATVGAISVQAYVEELSSVDPSETDLDSVDTSNLTSRTPSVPRMETQQDSSLGNDPVWGDSHGAEIVDNSGPSLFGEPLFKQGSGGPSLFGEPLFKRN